VSGTTIAIGPDTEIKGTISIGDTVKVHAIIATDGTLVAREIGFDDQVGEDIDDDNDNGNDDDDNGNDDDDNGNDDGGDDDNGNDDGGDDDNGNDDGGGDDDGGDD